MRGLGIAGLGIPSGPGAPVEGANLIAEDFASSAQLRRPSPGFRRCSFSDASDEWTTASTTSAATRSRPRRPPRSPITSGGRSLPRLLGQSRGSRRGRGRRRSRLRDGALPEGGARCDRQREDVRAAGPAGRKRPSGSPPARTGASAGTSPRCGRSWTASGGRRTRVYGEILIDHPRDTLALQIAHALDFYLGHRRCSATAIARVLPHWASRCPDYGYVLGMHAFGLEETGDYGRAESAGRKAVARNPGDVWAIHAVAHVMEMQGRTREGIQWLAGTRRRLGPPTTCSRSTTRGISRSSTSTSASTTGCSRVRRADPRRQSRPSALDLVDASAMLWRLHLRGVDAGRAGASSSTPGRRRSTAAGTRSTTCTR